MIRIERAAWAAMLAHATEAYPNECCGAMLGRRDSKVKCVTRAIQMENVSPGPHEIRYAVNPEDLIRTQKLARSGGLEVIGIYHSHPDHDACFSAEDLANSCPWYSFVVLSIRGGRFVYANCWLPDVEQRKAEPEELLLPDKPGTVHSITLFRGRKNGD